MSSSATLAPIAVRSAERPVLPVGAAAPVRTAVRLTSRGRAVLLAVIFVVALVMVVGGAASVSAVTAAPAPATRVVVVQPGQTLWQIAGQVAPDRDLRDVVSRISDLNDLTSPLVAPGQALVVPVG